MFTAVPEADATSDVPEALPPEIRDEFARLFADLDPQSPAPERGGAGTTLPVFLTPTPSHVRPSPPSDDAVRSWRRVFADDPGLLITCGVMALTVAVVVAAWFHVLARLDAVERRSIAAEERATAAARAAAASPDALRAAADVQRMMRVQSAVDVVQLTARGGEGSTAVQGHLWWSPSVGLAMWASPVPIPADAGLGYHAWLVTDAGTDYLGPVTRDDAGTITAAFDAPRHASHTVISVLVVLQPSYRLDHPGDMVVLEARF
jgi:hypothetical protein